MTSKIHGLTQAEAEKRLKEDGYNEVPEPKYNFWKEFASKLWNLSAWILGCGRNFRMLAVSYKGS